MQNTGIYTPAACQPRYQCPKCIRRFYNRAGLKNHVRALHDRPQVSQASDGASQISSILSDQLPSPQHSNDEEPEPVDVNPFPLEINDHEPSSTSSPPFFSNDAPMDVDFDVQLPVFDDYSSSHGSPPIIPSSPPPQHEIPRSDRHQQMTGNEKFLRRVYHDKLTGKFTIISLPHFNNLCITYRSEM